MHRPLLAVSLIALAAVSAPAQAAKVYDEAAGLVVMEAENSASPLGQWVRSTSLPDYRGSAYLEFTGNTHEGGAPNSPLAYHFRINETGTYILDLRGAKRLVNGQSDLANDVYVRVIGDFTAPSDTYDIPNHHASTNMLKTDLKYYGGKIDAWEWASGDAPAFNSTLGRIDPGGKNNKRIAAYQFKAGETYTLVVSGRSKDFRFDRVAFRKVGATANVDGAESRAFEGTPPQPVDADRLIQASAFSAESHPGNELIIANNGAAGVSGLTNDSWLRFGQFDFGKWTGGSIDVLAASRSTRGNIEVRVGSPTGRLLGTVHVRPTGAASQWTTFSGNLSPVQGKQDLYLTVKSADAGALSIRQFVVRSGETAEPREPMPPVRPPVGRLAYVADGNSPDPDDIGGTAAALAMLRVTGLDKRLVHLSVNCDLKPASNIPPAQEIIRQQQMMDAAEGTIKRWGGFEGLPVWNCRTQQDATVADLTKAINASSAADPLWLIEAGEPDVIGYALAAADPDKRKFVHLITHHPANDHSGDVFKFDQIAAFGVNVVRIPDQNGASFADITEGLQRPMWAFDWAKNHSDPRISWLWTQVDIAEKDDVVRFQKGKADISDAGMMFYWITGANVHGGYATPTMDDVMDLFGSVPNPVKK